MARPGRLKEPPAILLRGAELASAADVLGPKRIQMPDCPDGDLSKVGQTSLVAEVVAAADKCFPDGLLVFDTAPEPGRLDHVTATSAGLQAAESLRWLRQPRGAARHPATPARKAGQVDAPDE